MTEAAQIIVLNGAPRAGKSSIAAVIQSEFEGPWMNLGVDIFNQRITPQAYQPGIGLRPGGERPDLEPFIFNAYLALYESIAAHSRQGLNVVVDVGHHDDYSRSLKILPECARRLAGLPAVLVGVHCSLPVILERRRNTGYLTSEDGTVPPPVMRWQQAVHEPGIYDLEVDTSANSAELCAGQIRDYLLSTAAPTAFTRLSSQTFNSNQEN